MPAITSLKVWEVQLGHGDMSLLNLATPNKPLPSCKNSSMAMKKNSTPKIYDALKAIVFLGGRSLWQEGCNEFRTELGFQHHQGQL